MRVLGVIPARLGSTRLLNKPLQLLAGEPLVTRVVQRVAAVLTDESHSTGTERVAEVASRPEFRDFDVIVNIQGDEPFLDREALEGSLARVAQGDEVGTAAAPLELALVKDPARVKVVTDLGGRALYFSRAVIPHRREADDPAEGLYWQHLGIYAYTRASLAKWVSLPPTSAELAERLEQLRALQNGMTIGVTRLSAPALPGVDTPDDLKRAEAHWHALAR